MRHVSAALDIYLIIYIRFSFPSLSIYTRLIGSLHTYRATCTILTPASFCSTIEIMELSEMNVLKRIDHLWVGVGQIERCQTRYACVKAWDLGACLLAGRCMIDRYIIVILLSVCACE